MPKTTVPERIGKRNPGVKVYSEAQLDELVKSGKYTVEELDRMLEERTIILEGDRDHSNEEYLKMAKDGELEVEYREPHSLQETFTEENVKKFLLGELTWAQLEGMTIEEAYAIAKHGYKLFEQGRYNDAQAIFEGLVIGNPYDGYFHSVLGSIYAKKEMREEAVEEYGIALKLNPKDTYSRVNRGELLLQQGDFVRAMDDLKAAIELDKEASTPASARARALAAATATTIKELMEKKHDKRQGHPANTNPTKFGDK